MYPTQRIRSLTIVLLAGCCAVALSLGAPAAAGSHHDHGDHDHADHGQVGMPRPFHPDLPIDLSGVDGVSLQQQANAENLLAVTLRYLPRFADPAVAEAAGYVSVGDAGTGYEHLNNWAYMDDEHELDPLFPESLVYRVDEAGHRELVAAMYLVGGATLEDVSDFGGALMQWHTHPDLCFSEDPFVTGHTRIVGVDPPDQPCRSGVRIRSDPMIHVWIVPHECGPFAALPGVGAGHILPGEERWCDHLHGSP